VEVSGLDKVMADTTAKATTDVQKNALAEHLQLGDKMIEHELRTIESLMPRNAVAEGDKWQAGLRMELPAVGELKTRFDCSLAQVRDGKAVISADGLHEIGGPKAITVQGQAATLTKVEVKCHITLTLDIASGRMLGIETDSAGDIGMTAKDQNGQDQNVAVTVDNKETVTMEPGGGAAPGAAAPAPPS
jgi:hypothetical protein